MAQVGKETLVTEQTLRQHFKCHSLSYVIYDFLILFTESPA